MDGSVPHGWTPMARDTISNQEYSNQPAREKVKKLSTLMIQEGAGAGAQPQRKPEQKFFNPKTAGPGASINTSIGSHRNSVNVAEQNQQQETAFRQLVGFNHELMLPGDNHNSSMMQHEAIAENYMNNYGGLQEQSKISQQQPRETKPDQQRPQTKSVLASNNLDSRPSKGKPQVSIEDVLERRERFQDINKSVLGTIQPSKFANTSKYFFEVLGSPAGQALKEFSQIPGQDEFPLPDNKLYLDTLDHPGDNSGFPHSVFPSIIQSMTPQSREDGWRRSLYPSSREYEHMQRLKQLMQNTVGPFHQQPHGNLTFKQKLAQRQFEVKHGVASHVGGRSSASHDYRNQYKFKGFDPKALMVAQQGRMPPELSSRLQYKDYTESTARNIFSSQQSERRKNNRSTLVPGNRKHQQRGISIDQKDLEASLLLRNSFIPMPSTPGTGFREVGPAATFKVPNEIAQALLNRDRPDLYAEIVNVFRTGSRSPPIRQHDYSGQGMVGEGSQAQQNFRDSTKAKEEQINKEYVIKNYRVIHQKKRDFILPTAGPQQVATPTPLGEGSPKIRVSNSILSPNTFHFSTKLTLGRDMIDGESQGIDNQGGSIITPELTSPQSARAYMSLLKQPKTAKTSMQSNTPSPEKAQQPSNFQLMVSDRKDLEENLDRKLDIEVERHSQKRLQVLEIDGKDIKILETQDLQTDQNLCTTARAELIEANFKDIIASWIGGTTEGRYSQDYVESEDEMDDQDLQEIREKGFSAVKTYDLDNSFESLKVERKMILKMTLPQSQVHNQPTGDPSQEPYAHLKARNVFGKKSADYNRQIELVMHNPDNRTKARMLIELSKDFLTHMDHSQFTLDRLPLEIFDDFLLEADSIKQRIEHRRFNSMEPLKARTQYFRLNRDAEEVRASVVGYDETKRKFIAEFRVEGKLIRKHLGRLNLVFDDFDSKEHIEERRRLAKNLRRHALFKLNAERLFIQELARKYDFIKMPAAIKANIKKRLMVDLTQYDPLRVQVLALQVEALFVFSILKSIIYSQIGDPFISRIVARFNIEEISVTGKDVKDEIKEVVPRVPYYALKAYEERGGRLERLLEKREAIKILRDYAVLGKQSFIEAIQFLIVQNEDLVSRAHLFEFPVSEQRMLVYLTTQEEFAGKEIDELKTRLTVFPVQMHHFVKCQKVIARRFKETLEGRWTENVARKVEGIIDKEFKVDNGLKEIFKSQLNPYLLKLFELIRLYQEKNLLDKLTDTMESYVKFLLQFAIRDSQFTSSRAFAIHEYDKLRVRMSPHPMITIEVRVRKNVLDKGGPGMQGSNRDPRMTSGRRQGHQKLFSYDIATKPSLEDVWTDFSSILDMFVSSCSRIRRIDEMVIPQLKLKRNTLMQFDKLKQPKLLHFSKLTSTILESMRSQPEQRLNSFNQYTPLLDLTFDQLLLDLKIKTYAEQNSGADDDLGHQHHDDEDESEAYEDVEITEAIYQQRFAELRQAYWGALLNISNQYDYGMVVLDCEAFRTLVTKHIERLLKSLERHILDDFLRRMNTLSSQYELVEKKATDRASTIDDVILLIEFIENIQKPDELLDELETMMEELKLRKAFIDDLRLKLESGDFEKYLHLFSYPSKLRLLLIRRKFSLENEREVLSAQMAQEKDRVLKSIIIFREYFEYFKKVGLYKPGGTLFIFPNSTSSIVDKKAESQRTIIKKRVSSLDHLAGAAAQALARGPDSGRGKKTQIVSLVDDQGNQFVPQYISENAARMEKLKSDLEATEQECEIINRREKLLNFRITKFTAVSNLKTDMAPFATLWNIAQSFTRVYENWLHGTFADLDSDNMDELLQEWFKQLTRISKTNLASYDQPVLLVNYLLRELEKFKEYMPMITAMRAKGLEKRHWHALAKQLGFDQVDSATMTLANLIDMKLHEGPQLEVIKAVCEVAMREWTIKTTLDSLEAELKNIEFSLSKYKDQPNTFVLKGLEELMVGFEEFTIKVVGLKANAFAKPFAERISKVEREFRTVVDVLDEWIRTQKSWIYLEPIFTQKDLAKQMAQEAAKFGQLDTFYRKEIGLMRSDPQVHKYCRREHILSSLQYVNKEFETISKGLTVYLESKREHFARFYFLSNEEIIEILGQMRDPRNVQRFLNKIFEGVESLQFTPYGLINGVFSKEEEHLALKKVIDPVGDTAESWLKDLESGMKLAVRSVIQGSYLDFRMKDFETWVKSWQGQAAVVVLNVILTDTLQEIFTFGQLKRLKDVLNQVVYEIEALTKMIRTKVTMNTRTSICSLLINRVHARDTLKNMIEGDIRSASDFFWMLQMKYEFSKPAVVPRNMLQELRQGKQLQADNEPKGGKQQPARNNVKESGDGMDQDIFVSMVDARKPYGYEYLGNAQRIVITPLTERCFRALFMALHFNYGGSPEGPVGTGKTETTKDLSKCLGKQCFVFNCSSSLNYEAMSKFFKGLATSGAWSCFDEFNRIDLAVLSVISQIIIFMQSAIREDKSELQFEGTLIQFNKECAIFITMNPQFLGRTDLPDNLKSLFRPVAMIVPDSTLISEIQLYSSGFLQAKPLAKKLVRAFRLAKQQLSNQIHYEFGLRSIKIVLQIASLMKLKASGVIEPDFKIKEGKKLKAEDGEDSPRKDLARQNRLARNGKEGKRKGGDQNDRAAYLQYMRKQESSLDSDDVVKRRRNNSFDSDDFNLKDKVFLKPQGNPIQNKKVEDVQGELQTAVNKAKRLPEIQFRRIQLDMHRATRKGLEKFNSKRNPLIRGNIEKAMDKRLEALEGLKDEAKQTRKLMKVLGIDNEELIHDEFKIEEFILLRAINDTNLPKLHQNDTVIFKGIIDDIFPNPIKQSTKRSSLKSLLEDVMQSKTMSMTEEIMERVLHLYETVMIRHGVMIVGTTMTGKTTSIQLLQECLNRSRENELEERVHEFKLKKAKKIAIQNLNKKQWQDDDYNHDEARALAMELSFEEMKQVRHQCRNKGVATFTINPKSLTNDQLMGRFDENSHDWNDGIMAHAMRTCSQDTSERRNWIVFDGPIDPVWVENLNSVLDDNKKLTLSTGESIKMTGLMTIILEAEDLSNSTPATISRCGMIYMKDDILPLKAILNQWVKKLPLFLEDIASEVDLMCNYFIPEILDKFMFSSNQIYPVSQKWAIKNFCRIMDAMMNDFRSEKFNQLTSMNATALALYNSPDKSSPAGTGRSGDGSAGMEKDQQERAQGTTPSGGGGQGKRPFHLQFSDVEARFQNAFKSKTMWVQNFFLFSLVWAFGSILTLSVRKDFEELIKSKLVYNAEEVLANSVQQKTKTKGGAPPPTPVPTGKHQSAVTKKAGGEAEAKSVFHPSTNFKATEKAPEFLCKPPSEASLFDIYFDLEANHWQLWESLRTTTKDDGALGSSTADAGIYRRQGSIFTRFLPTTESIRLGYLVEANLVCRNNLMLLGPTGCGKSWLAREILFKQLPVVSSRYKSSTIVFSSSSSAEKAQHFIDQRLEKRRKGVYGPPFLQKFIFFIDDLMMPHKDEFGSQSANELLRQWFDFGGWFDTKSLDFKKVEDIQFISCITIYDAHKTVISSRNEWHWTYIGAVNMDEKHYLSLFSQILEYYSIHWPSCVQGSPMKSAIKGTLELYKFFEETIKPTPNKFLYHFNIRHVFKIIYGIAEVDPTYLRTEFDLAKLWIHESWRTLCDRIQDTKDQKLIFKKMKDIARSHFKTEDNKFSKQHGWPFFSPFNKGAEGLYIESVNFAETTTYLRKYLADYNEMHKKQRINVVLFDFLVEFLLKVLRVIKQPYSHAILIGIEGSGKQAVCQLATTLAGFQFHQIKFDAHYSQEDWQGDLKHLLNIAGAEMKEIVFHLKHNQIVKESFLDDLNTLVNNGEVQNLFNKEEYETIIQQISLRLQGNSNNSSNGPEKISAASSQMALGEFSQKCRENLKVVLNFTPSGANLRQRVRDHKQLVNCSTVICLDNWPNEGYREVAETLLPARDTAVSRTENLSSLNREQVLDIALKIHMDAISLSKNYFFETQHFLHITPHLFQDYINCYKTLYNEKRLNLNDMRRRYETGLQRLQTTQEQVEKFSSHLESNSPLLIDKQIEVERILERLKDEHDNFARIKDILVKEEQELIVQKEQAELIRGECEHNLQQATPELYAAISALQSLSKADINELKSLKNPPTAIKLLMEGVCLALGIEPIKTKAKDGVTIVKDYWTVATGKIVLGNPRLVEILSAFDSTAITSDTMASLEELTQNPEFVLENVARASKAGKGLWLWLNAVKNYFYVYQETSPKRDALFYSEKQMIDKESDIKQKQQELVDLQNSLEYLSISHKNLESDIAILQTEIDECSVKKERAAKLLNGLGGERQKWLVCNRMIDKRFVTIQGDVLLGAAFITYLSGFTQKFRERSVEVWGSIIKRHGIGVSDDFSFNKIFGDQIKIKEWMFNGLPGDSFSIQNAVILEKCTKQPICIDPQYQANKWIKMQDVKDLKILNFSDSNFSQQLEWAMKFGKRVLIENVGQKIDLIIYPLIKKEYINEGGSLSLNIFGHQVELDPRFKLFIMSELKNPRFGPDIAVLTTQVNFHVTIEGLEEQMLSIVITNQKSELEEESVKMRKEALNCIKILKKLEDDILDSLGKDLEAILTDEKLIETLENSKKTSRQIGESLQRVNRASTILLKSRGIYTPAAYRAAILYFLVCDIAKIEYMYQFSLKWYIDIFTEEVKSKKHTDQDPLLDIIKNFTYTLYRKVCQSIFEKDKLLFTFLLAFRILEGEKCLDEKLFEFFLHGQQNKDKPSAQEGGDQTQRKDGLDSDEEDDMSEEQKAKKRRDNLMEKISNLTVSDEGLSNKASQATTKEDADLKKRKKAFTWISDHQWMVIDRLSQVPPFNKPSIVEHILDNQDLWLAYINAKDSDNIPMPGNYLEYDPVKEERLAKRLKAQKKARAQGVRLPKRGRALDDIEEDLEEEEQQEVLIPEDEIWHLDDEDSDDGAAKTMDGTDSEAGGMDALLKTKPIVPEKQTVQTPNEDEQYTDDRENIADSIVAGVPDYQEVRYGSVRFEKELATKKQQVLKDLIRFCIIRIFMPEKIVREVQRFLGSVLDPRFMEPPVFNLPQLHAETSSSAPILFIQSPNTNVLNELTILKFQLSEPNQVIEYMPLGGNVSEKAQAMILKAATQGSWVLLENLHLVTSWIPQLEKYMQEMYKIDKQEAEKQANQNNGQRNTRMPQKSVIIKEPPMLGSFGQGQQNQNGLLFPELAGVRIHPKFRLWLSSMPVDYFPVSFLQDCVKLTLQPAQGIRQNALKLLNSTGVDFLQRISVRQPEFRKLFYALTIFHAVVVERQRFGPLGFSAHAYQFSENDFIISTLQLQYLLQKVQGENDPLPLDLLRYLVGTLNYGGRIVKRQDEVTLNALLETFINEKTCFEQNYKLTGTDGSESGIYFVPGDGDLGHYKMFIGKFPVQDRPEIFGLHRNAIIQRQTSDGKSLMEKVFEFQFASKEMNKTSAILESNDAGINGDGERFDHKAASFKRRIMTIIKELPDLLDEQLCRELYPISYEHCFNTLLTKEVQRYNILMQVIYLSMKNTLKALEGVIHINAALDDVYKSLTYEHVPTTWYKYCCQTFKSLPLFLQNLGSRVEFIRQFLKVPEGYIRQSVQFKQSVSNNASQGASSLIPPAQVVVKDHWLPGYFDPQGFLTTLLQQKARTDKVSIETLAVDFKMVKPHMVQHILAENKPGQCLMHGLWLEGAKWQHIDETQGDMEAVTLQDQVEAYGSSIYHEMPHFLLRVISQTEFDLKYNNDKYYHCPVYMTGMREKLDRGNGGDLFDDGIVTKIPLYIGMSGPPGSKSNTYFRQPGFWIKRGAALLCHADD